MDLERAYGRIIQLSLALTLAGAGVYVFRMGWRGGFGFLLGAGIAFLNFYWLKRTVFAIGDLSGNKPPKARVAIVLGLRYLLLGLAAYAILRFSQISVTAFVVGLFAPTAAVILEILIELFYAGT